MLDGKATGRFYDSLMVPEAPVEQTESGLVAAGDGWLVLNAREARRHHADGRGARLTGAGVDQETTEVKEAYAQLPPREPTQYREGWLGGS